MNIEWDFDELVKFSDNLISGNLENTFREITKKISRVLLDHIKGFTPIDKTGKLINGWNGNAFVVIPMGDGFKVEIVNKAEYATWVNDGHRVRNRPNGEYLQVHRRVKVPTPHKWQKPVSDYYVFGHFFVERGILQLTNTKQIEEIIMQELQTWWMSV